MTRVRFKSTGNGYEVLQEGERCLYYASHQKHAYEVVDGMTGYSIITTMTARCCARVLQRERTFGRYHHLPDLPPEVEPTAEMEIALDTPETEETKHG